MKLASVSVVMTLLVIPTAAPAPGKNLKELPAAEAQRVAELLTAKAKEMESPQIKLDVDPAKANGWSVGDDGLLIAPQKNLREDPESEAARAPEGAPLAYLFMTDHFEPLVGDKPVEPGRLRTLTIIDDDGARRTVRCFLLAVRRVGEDDWRLYAYGKDRKPLIDSPFETAEARPNRPLPVAVSIENVSGFQGTLAVAVFGKYQAGFRIRYTGY